MIAQLKLIVGQIEARFTSLLAFKAWAAGTALKKRRKRFAQVQNRLIRSILRHLPGPGKLFPPDLIELLLETQCAGLLAGFIVPIPLSQRPIPHKSCGPCGFRKVAGLLRRGLESDLVCLDHP